VEALQGVGGPDLPPVGLREAANALAAI
jgi:hypothetical protein